MNLVFRNAEISDSDEISKLLKVTWLHTYSRFMPLQLIEAISGQWHTPELIKQIIKNSQAVVWVGVYENRITGVFSAQLIKDKDYYLNQLYVHPDFQGLGLGSLLLKLFIKNHQPNTIKLSVMEGNEKSIRFYEARKFIIHSMVVEKFTGFDLNTVRMIWRV